MLKSSYHTSPPYCLCVLSDGRLVSGSSDNNIIIYNKKTYKPDIIIKEHKNAINCIINLKSNFLASCSWDTTIKVFKINNNNNNYINIQTLDYHAGNVYKIIELKNKKLVSCSDDNSIIFYFKNNDKYQQDYKITTKGSCRSIVQTKENEIAYLETANYLNYNISFFDFNEKEIKSTISNLNSCGNLGPFNMITKDLLVYARNNLLYLINVNEYEIISFINVPDSFSIYGFCMLNENMFLTGGSYGGIRQWKIEGENIVLFSQKEKAHNGNIIFALTKLRNGKIATCSNDNAIEIW
jgi:WD40 repeat protein